jgi:hypothetical protein
MSRRERTPAERRTLIEFFNSNTTAMDRHEPFALRNRANWHVCDSQLSPEIMLLRLTA